MRTTFPRHLAVWPFIPALALSVPLQLSAQETPEEQHCVEAERFLIEGFSMTAITEPDTVNDWRTRQTVYGCRITAAGLTNLDDMDAQATHFYREVEAAGWTRTPDPRDAPNEAAIRYRMDDSDCLFNFYEAGHLGSPADLEVSTEVVPGPGERRFNIYVMCMPAMEAAPRTPPGGPGQNESG